MLVQFIQRREGADEGRRWFSMVFTSHSACAGELHWGEYETDYRGLRSIFVKTLRRKRKSSMSLNLPTDSLF